EVDRQLPHALVLRLPLGARRGRQRLCIHHRESRRRWRQDPRPEPRLALRQRRRPSVVAHLHRRRRVHKPPDLRRLLRPNLILHQHLAPLPQPEAAPHFMRVFGIGGREIGDRKGPLGLRLEGGDARGPRGGPGLTPARLYPPPVLPPPPPPLLYPP